MPPLRFQSAILSSTFTALALAACTTTPETGDSTQSAAAPVAATTPPSEAREPVDVAPMVDVPPTVVSDAAAPVLDRLLNQYGPLNGVSVVARHRIQAPDRILNETVRMVYIDKPDKFKVDENGITLAVSDGTDCRIFNRSTQQWDTAPVPASLPEAIRDVRALGGGSIAGSGGIVAALLSDDPRATLLDNVDRVEHRSVESDDLLILHIRDKMGTVRKGTRVGLFIPREGPAWIAQADIIPPGVTVHTRIAFEDWKPSDTPASAVALTPETSPLNPNSRTTP